MREERGTNASHQPFPHMFVLFCFVVFACLVVVVAHQIDALLPVAGVVVVVVKEKEHRDWC